MFARLIACALVVAAVAPVRAAAPAPHAPGPHTHRLTYPAKDWSLDVDLPDFKLIHEEFFGEGRRQILMAGLRKGDKLSTPPVLLNVTLEPHRGAAAGAGLSAWAVEMVKKSKATEGGSVKAFEHKGIPVVRYRTKVLLGSVVIPPSSYQPFAITGRNIDAYLVKDDILITIRIGGESLGDKDEKTFLSVLDSVRLTDTSLPSSSFDLYHAGKLRLAAKDYAGAARSLGAALNLELQGGQLGPEQFRGLIERSLEVLDAKNDLDGAKRVLEFAVTRQPENPLFHYLLARIHAGSGALDLTILSLGNAYRHNKNLPRTHVPLNPLYDPYFARFKNDEKFRKAVKAMKK